MSYSVTFWNVIAKRYANSPVSNEDVYQKKLTASRNYFAPHMNVLEFGCGTGSTALVHAPFVKHYTAVDVSSKMLAIAKEKLAKTEIKNLVFEKSAIEKWAGQREAYDVILGLSIVHLLHDPDATLEKIHDMLKPGGVLITSTACLKGKISFIMKWVLCLGGIIGILPKIQFFNREELELRINKAGFVTEFILPEAEPTDSRFMISVKAKENELSS